jgi:hypothetical protein
MPSEGAGSMTLATGDDSINRGRLVER